MLDMLKHYTIEQLQETDIDLLLPLYFWYCRQHEEPKEASKGTPKTAEIGKGKIGDIVIRNGKPYRVVSAKETGDSNIF